MVLYKNKTYVCDGEERERDEDEDELCRKHGWLILLFDSQKIRIFIPALFASLRDDNSVFIYHVLAMFDDTTQLLRKSYVRPKK